VPPHLRMRPRERSHASWRPVTGATGGALSLPLGAAAVPPRTRECLRNRPRRRLSSSRRLSGLAVPGATRLRQRVASYSTGEQHGHGQATRLAQIVAKQATNRGSVSGLDVSHAAELGMSALLRDLAGMQRRIDGEVTVPGSWAHRRMLIASITRGAIAWVPNRGRPNPGGSRCQRHSQSMCAIWPSSTACSATCTQNPRGLSELSQRPHRTG